MVAISPTMDAALLPALSFSFSGSVPGKLLVNGISSAQVGVLIHINLILPRGGDMAKLTDKQHKKIIARYAECQNLSQVAREFNVSVSTIKRHLDGDKETVKRVNQKKEQNTLDMIAFMESRKNKAQEFIDLCFEEMNERQKIGKAGVQSIAIAMGIIVDKFIQSAPPADNAQLQHAKEILGDIDGVIK